MTKRGRELVMSAIWGRSIATRACSGTTYHKGPPEKAVAENLDDIALRERDLVRVEGGERGPDAARDAAGLFCAPPELFLEKTAELRRDVVVGHLTRTLLHAAQQVEETCAARRDGGDFCVRMGREGGEGGEVG